MNNDRAVSSEGQSSGQASGRMIYVSLKGQLVSMHMILASVTLNQMGVGNSARRFLAKIDLVGEALCMQPGGS